MALTNQYLAAFKVLLTLSGIKEGDTVRLTAAPGENYGNESEFFASYENENAQECIGQRFIVVGVCSNSTILIEHEHDCVEFTVPIWCVIKDDSTKVELNDEYSAILSSDGKTITVGCQEIPAAAVLKLAKAIEAAGKSVAKKAAKRVGGVKKVTRRPAPMM
jgi:hypothetical protein